jgi:hypothetical protein
MGLFAMAPLCPQDLVDEMDKLVLADAQQHERESLWIAERFDDLRPWVRRKYKVDSYQS